MRCLNIVSSFGSIDTCETLKKAFLRAVFAPDFYKYFKNIAKNSKNYFEITVLWDK